MLRTQSSIKQTSKVYEKKITQMGDKIEKKIDESQWPRKMSSYFQDKVNKIQTKVNEKFSKKPPGEQDNNPDADPQ